MWLEPRTAVRCARCGKVTYVCAPAPELPEAPPQPPQVCALSRWAAPAAQEHVERFEPAACAALLRYPKATSHSTQPAESPACHPLLSQPFSRHTRRLQGAGEPPVQTPAPTAAVRQHLERLPPVSMAPSVERSPAPKITEQQNTTQPHLPCPGPVRTA